jgi:hypothetical protein
MTRQAFRFGPWYVAGKTLVEWNDRLVRVLGRSDRSSRCYLDHILGTCRSKATQ